MSLWGHIKISCFPSQRASLYFHFIEFDVLRTTINCFSVKADPFALYFNKNTFLPDFTIYFYGKNTFYMTCGKWKIILVSKISISSCKKDKNKNARAHHFLYLQRTGSKKFSFLNSKIFLLYFYMRVYYELMNGNYLTLVIL